MLDCDHPLANNRQKWWLACAKIAEVLPSALESAFLPIPKVLDMFLDPSYSFIYVASFNAACDEIEAVKKWQSFPREAVEAVEDQVGEEEQECEEQNHYKKLHNGGGDFLKHRELT